MAVATTVVTLTDSTATQVLAPDGSRLDCIVTNTGTSRVYLGTDNTVSNRGNAILDLRTGEGYRYHDATASLYAYSVVQGGAAGQLTVVITNPE